MSQQPQQGRQIQVPQSGQGQTQQGQQGGSQSLLFGTSVELPQQVRVNSIQTLNELLADTSVLRTQAKFAHWNVRGIDFYQLHELFEDLAEVLAEQEDEIAERATALGGQAMGTARIAARNARVPSIQHDATSEQEYVAGVARSLSVHGANLRRAIDELVQGGDQDTADMLTEVSREVDKYLWFLEAHLLDRPVGSVPATRTAGQQAGGQRAGGQQTGGQQIGGQQVAGQQSGMAQGQSWQ